MSATYGFCVKAGHVKDPNREPVCVEHLASAIRAQQDLGHTVMDRDGRPLLPGRTYRYCGVCGEEKAGDSTWVHEECLTLRAKIEPSGLSPSLVAEILQIVDRLRAMRESVDPKTSANPTYHALSTAISALSRAGGGGAVGE